jgi:lipoprotein-anchoring transpeptidase ErfK/SrfK
MCPAFQSFLKRMVALRNLGKVLVFLPFLAGCATNRESSAGPFFPNGNTAEQNPEYGDEISYWDDKGSGGKPRIVIDLNEQRAYFYRGNKMVGISIVSTGREGHDTPSGEFRVTEKDPTHVSSIYGDYVDRSGQVMMENVDVTKDRRPRGAVFRGAAMPYFLRIQGSIGMHAGYLPGYPASHGCIRLPKAMAVRFYRNAAVGTPVVIREQAPQEYAPNPNADLPDVPFTSIMDQNARGHIISGPQ